MLLAQKQHNLKSSNCRTVCAPASLIEYQLLFIVCMVLTMTIEGCDSVSNSFSRCILRFQI
jgi:hypothetical protein